MKLDMQSYNSGRTSALEHRLNMEIMYLEHLSWMLTFFEDTNANLLVLTSIADRIATLKSEYKNLTEQQAV